MSLAGPVSVKGECVADGEAVTLHGKVFARVHGECALCLKPLTIKVQAPLAEVFVRAIREEDDENPDQRLYEGQSVPMDDAVQQALLLALPMRILCKEDCLGLCPVCGQDRNQMDCGHGDQVPEGPFAVLRQLLDDKEV